MLRSGAQLITTIKERCRTCYTCVRDCPAKAIRIVRGQAEVIGERCIGCGNCVRVCRQQAKSVLDGIVHVRELLAGKAKVAAILAPSFPAEYHDTDWHQVVGMVRKLGFHSVHEVAFGADLVARAYRRLLDNYPDRRHIATTCPAVVTYVEKYHPELVPNLAPIVSPMIAEARVLRRLLGSDLRVVFIGPCLAKKSEAGWNAEHPEVDGVLTFIELNRMFAEDGITAESVAPTDFDPPHAGIGALFPISHGMLQAAGISEDLLSNDVVAVDGTNHFTQAIEAFGTGALDVRLLETLCCNGCINGSGIDSRTPEFKRRVAVSQFVRERIHEQEPGQWQKWVGDVAGLDLHQEYTIDDQRLGMPSPQEMREILSRMGKTEPEDELDCGACGYATCREHAVAIHKGLAESEMCLPWTIDRLNHSLVELHDSNAKLASARQALINAEKLASMGQLSAGIAHEINNPLGVILLYAKMMQEEAGDDQEKIEDLCMIVEQAERCKKIVSGLLNFARKSKVNLAPADIREIIDHSLKAIQVPASVTLAVEHQMTESVAPVDADQLVQVLTNLVRNAIEAMPDGGNLKLLTDNAEGMVRIQVSDSGTGIEQQHLQKIFEPLFTTKKLGEGTGLGLAVTYGIVKMHRGNIEVKSNADPAKGATGTTFIITLPLRNPGGTDSSPIGRRPTGA